MIFGQKECFALEVIIHDYASGFILGQLQMWVRGDAVGDFDDTVAIQGCANWLRDFLKFSGNRTLPDYGQLSGGELIRVIFDRIEDFRAREYYDWREKFELNAVGMTAFDDINMVLIERNDGSEWIIWSDKHFVSIHEATLPSGEFARVSYEFLHWLYRTDEWNAYQQWLTEFRVQL